MKKIRRATLEDAEGIAKVVRQTWNQSIDYVVYRSHIEEDTCSIWIAVEDNEVAGFVSAFLTIGSHQTRRWEIDLVVVRPSSQGKGLGSRLIQTALNDAKKHCVGISRAIIRTENIASQKAFQRAGYVTDERVQRMFLWSPKATGRRVIPPENITLSRMDTLTYRGLWIEGLMSESLSQTERRNTVIVAQALIAEEGRLNTGCLIPSDLEGCLPEDVLKTATIHGEYHWWLKSLNGV